MEGKANDAGLRHLNLLHGDVLFEQYAKLGLTGVLKDNMKQQKLGYSVIVQPCVT